MVLPHLLISNRVAVLEYYSKVKKERKEKTKIHGGRRAFNILP